MNVPADEVVARARGLTQPGVWGDELAIMAAACFLGRAIQAFDEATTSLWLFQPMRALSKTPMEPLSLWNRGNHFYAAATALPTLRATGVLVDQAGVHRFSQAAAMEGGGRSDQGANLPRMQGGGAGP
eukprot:6472766-Amphidinium_carterae.1